MKAIAVNCIPEKRHGNHRLQNFLREFVNTNTKLAKIELNVDEYKSPTVARNCIGVAIVRGRYPVKVKLRGNDIYLVRTDM